MIFVFQLVVVVAALAASIAGWWAVLRRVVRGQAVLLRQSRPPAPWGMIDLLFAAVMLVTFQLFNALLLRQAMGVAITPDWQGLSSRDLTLVLFSQPIANLAAMAIALLAIGLRTRACAADFGLRLGRAWQDLWLGTTTFVLLAPLVYGLQRILVIWYPYEHPLISVLESHPEALVQGAVFFSAVVGAPITEEFFYRVLWQGGLYAFALHHRDLSKMVFGNAGTLAPVAGGASSAEDESAAANGGSNHDATALGAQVATAEVFAVVASSALFALMHVSQGPAPIPLFVLALGLGYVYARTGRVLPCIVVHVWLNAWSLITLWIGLAFGPGS